MGRMIVDNPNGVLAEVGKLLREREPIKVVADTDLPAGSWYVVRGALPDERRYLKTTGDEHHA